MATKVALEPHMQLVALGHQLADLAVAAGALLHGVLKGRQALRWVLQDALMGEKMM